MGHGVNGSAKYCVVYPQGEEIEVDEAGGTVISGFYVTNEAWAVDAILNGDGMTPGGFTTGDWYKLTVIGTHADETTEQVEFYLADYRSENEADHYYVKDWQWVDLTALGQVESVTFRLDSSRKNDWGMTTPGYFCIDDFNGVAQRRRLSERLRRGVVLRTRRLHLQQQLLPGVELLVGLCRIQPHGDHLRQPYPRPIQQLRGTWCTRLGEILRGVSAG